MKKRILMFIVGLSVIINACIPTTKELEEKRIADSIRVADSLTMVKAEQQKMVDLQEISNPPGEISNPLTLNYDYDTIRQVDDGSKYHTYIEKGKIDDGSGDYIWSKMVPLYASQSDAAQGYEYQMDFTEKDLDRLYDWILQNLGENISVGIIDAPPGFKGEPRLSVIYDYCMKHKTNFVLGIANKKEKKLANIVFDYGEKEVALIYFILF